MLFSSLCLAGFLLLIQSSACFRLFLRCLVFSSLCQLLWWLWFVAAPPVVLLSLYRFSLSSGRVGYLLWLSCLSLAVVLCFSGSSCFLPSFVSFCLPVCLSFHSALASLVSPWCSLCDFASVTSSLSPVRRLRIEFRSPYSLVGCSDFSSASVGVLLDIGLPFSFLYFSSLSAFLWEFSLPFASGILTFPFVLFYRPVCLYMRLSLSSPLSARLLWPWCFAAFLRFRSFVRLFSSVFYPSQFSSSVLSPLSRDCIPWLVCTHSFRFFLPSFGHTFVSIASAVSLLVLFLLAPWVA